MRKFLPIIFLTTAITFILFRPFFTDQKIPIAIDIPVAMYYPWLNYNYGYPVHVPVKNAILTDTISQFWIWRNWAVDGLRLGQIKIWNPYSFSGYEISPWFGTTIFQPLNIFYWLTDKLNAMSWIVISQLIIGLFGSWLWSKKIITAIVWVLSSYFLGWMTWGTVSLGLAILPWMLWAVDRNFLVLSITTGLLILSGHPQTILYMFIITGIYILIKWWPDKKPLVLLKKFWGIILGFGLTAIVLWPSIPIIADSIRLKEDALSPINYGFINPQDLIPLLLTPNFFGNPGTNNYWGGEPNFQEKLINFGIIGLYLSLIGLIDAIRKKDRHPTTILALVCLVLGIFLSQKYPLGWAIYFFKVPFLASSPAGRAFILTIFGASIFAGKAIEIIFNTKKWAVSVVYATAIMIFFWVISIIHISGLESDHQIIATRNLLVSSSIWLTSVFILVIGFKFKLKKIVIGSFILLIIFEGWWFNQKYTPFVDKKLYFPSTPTTDFLKNDPELFFRVERQSAELLPPNMWQIYGLYSTSGYDPINPTNYGNYLIEKWTRSFLGRYVENGNATDIEKLDMLGIKYWLVLKDTLPGNPLPKWVNPKNWDLVFSEGRVAILKNKNYTPAYQLKNDGLINLVKKNEDYWNFQVTTENVNQLILRENFTNNWQVKVDGNFENLAKIEGTFKAVNTPPGSHQIEFIYQNKQIITGKIISFISLLLLLGLILLKPRARVSPGTISL